MRHHYSNIKCKVLRQQNSNDHRRYKPQILSRDWESLMALLTFPKAQNKVELIGLLSDELAMLSHRHSRIQQLDAIHFVALMSSWCEGNGKNKKKGKVFEFFISPDTFFSFPFICLAPRSSPERGKRKHNKEKTLRGIWTKHKSKKKKV